MSHPTAYLVLASQRSGSTLLVESLRATGVAGEPGEFFQYLASTSQSPQPRQWFEGVEDESILRLLDPLDEGKPDLAPPEIWRDYIRTVGRTPNGIWGGKLMWNQTPLLLRRAAGLPDRSGDGLLSAIRDVVGSDPVLIHVYRPDVVSQAVSFWRAVQTRVWRGRPDPLRDARAEYHAGAIAHVVSMLRAQELAQVVRRGERRTDGSVVSDVVAQPHSSCRHGTRGNRTGPTARAGTGAGTPSRPALR
jgi:LPS sulfotransferase NodH